MGGSKSSVSVASSYKKIGFQMSKRNVGLLPYLSSGVSLIFFMLMSLPGSPIWTRTEGRVLTLSCLLSDTCANGDAHISVYR